MSSLVELVSLHFKLNVAAAMIEPKCAFPHACKIKLHSEPDCP